MRILVKVQQAKGRFMAWCPALPGCRTQAATSDGARQLMEDAIRGYLSSLNVAVPQLLEQQLVES